MERDEGGGGGWSGGWDGGGGRKRRWSKYTSYAMCLTSCCHVDLVFCSHTFNLFFIDLFYLIIHIFIVFVLFVYPFIFHFNFLFGNE